MPVTVAKAPPARKPAPSIATGTGQTTMTRKAKERAEGLAGIGQLLTAGLLFARQTADAGAVSKHWPNIAQETAKLADENAKVGEVIDSIIGVGPYAGLITAVLPLAMQIMVNHDKLRADQVSNMGIVSKETLQSQVKQQIMQAEMEAMRMEMEIADQRRQMEAEYRSLVEASQKETTSDD